MKFLSLQILRFVAAAMVVHLHAAERVFEATGTAGILGQPGLLFGRAGVDIFFVISGFIISVTGRRLSAGQFLAKRARRLLPIYLVLGGAWLIKTALESGIGWRDVLATLFLWPATDTMTVPLVPAAWTLCFEMLFYGTFALILWRRSMAWVVIGVFAAALVIRDGAVLKFIGNPIIFEFIAGVGLAQLTIRRWWVAGLPIGFGGLVIGAGLLWPPYGSELDFLLGTEAWMRLLTLGLPAVAIVAGTLALTAREGVLTSLGDGSYSLYLMHAPIVGGAVTLMVRLTELPADAMIAVAVALSIWIGWRIHVLFERPLTAWLGRRPLPV